ncbi:MAG TPA: dicarboxylate/amino acid:cation symporter [Longimicrobiales bacterium]|nr:dicarboxylate/amino acid:cation symporter [Longimicrobiales bacterium]
MSLTTRVLLGLALGLAAGIAISLSGSPQLVRAAGWVEPFGRIWVNGLSMTIIPLVLAGLIVGAAGAGSTASLGRLGARALAIMLIFLAATAAGTIALGPLLLRALPITPDAAAALLAQSADAPAAPTVLPSFRDWLVALIPPNALRAGVDGAMLPLIVFAVIFGIALSRIAAPARASVIAVFAAVFDTMLLIIRWLLELAPFGVFALALPLATRLGIATAGAVGYYIAVVAGMAALLIAALYPVASLLGRVPMRRFARGAAPAQALAFSSRSSLASLPAMIEGGELHLRFPPAISRFFLPLAASTFRTGGALGIPLGVLFVARLYGIELEPTQLTTIAITSALLTFSVPGVPGGSILIMMPVLQAVGLPAAAVGLLLGVDTVPDMFRTTANVTADMAAATILARYETVPARDEAPAALPV